MLYILLCALCLSQPVEHSEPPAHVRQYIERCERARATHLPLPLPPKKQDVGIFEPPSATDARRGRSIDVLEVVDEDNAIMRAWYAPRAKPKGHPTREEDPTFVDLWIHGIDTSALAAGAPANLRQVFEVTGNKSFGTTCGSRSLPLLEPIDIERYQRRGQELTDDASQSESPR